MTDPRDVQHVEAGGLDSAQLMVLFGLSAVLFFFGLTVLEPIPEIPVDIDQKPFFIPLMLVALLPAGRPAWAIGAGAALGEGLGDLIEGYEIDDPFGFVGYAVAFGLATYVVGPDPRNRVRLVLAALFAGSLQAVIEVSTFLVFDGESASVFLWAWAGNTVTHGIIGGAIPLLLVVPRFHGTIERFLGFAPKGVPTRPLEQLLAEHGRPGTGREAMA